MYYVYAISSLERNYIYVRLTDNLERNFLNITMAKTTNPHLPFKIIYTQEFKTRLESRQEEKYFKSGIGKEKLTFIKESLMQ